LFLQYHIFVLLNLCCSVLWRDNNRIVLFPPMSSFPSMGHQAKTDFLAWVGSGEPAPTPLADVVFIVPFYASGNCVVFLGDYKNVQFMNDLFGFSLQTAYCSPVPHPFHEHQFNRPD
jgi:hypothetical protein